MRIVKGVNVEEEAANYIENVAKMEYRSFAAQAAMILEEWVVKRKEVRDGKEKETVSRV